MPCSRYVTSRTSSLSCKKWRERAIGSCSSPSSSGNPGGSGRRATLSQEAVCHSNQPEALRELKRCSKRTNGSFSDQFDKISRSYSQQKTILRHAVSWARQHDTVGGRCAIGKGRVALHSEHSSSCSANIVLGALTVINSFGRFMICT
jgi:hypothetical protein